MASERDELRNDFVGLLRDEAAHAARQAFCRVAAEGFSAVGHVLYFGGWVQHDPQAQGLADAAQIGGEVALGAVDLLDAERRYAAAALVRQLVEVEYLLWTFADSPEDAAKWKVASSAQLGRHFKSSVMRQRAGDLFRHAEYQSHCRLGGHPSPRASFLLPGHSAPFSDGRYLWVDLGHHLERGWGFLLSAAHAASWITALPAPRVQAVSDARTHWHEQDPLATRLPAGVFEEN